MRRLILALCTLHLFTMSLKAEELVVVVNKNNTTNSLSKNEVIDIYMGRYITFPDGGNAKPLDLPSQSDYKNAFYLQLVKQTESKINAYWARLLFSGRAKPPESVSSVEEALQQLQNSEKVIAYIPESEMTDNLKVVYRLNEN